MDALSQALSAVDTTGAIFYRVECTAPWGFAVPPVDTVAHLLSPGTEHLVNYHLVVEGEALVRLPSGDEHHVTAGQVVVLPHGDPHTVSWGSPRNMVDSRPPLVAALGGGPQTVHMGGGGSGSVIICGFFGCEQHAERTFLAGLPPLFIVDLRTDAAGTWLERSVRHFADEAESDRPGTAAMLTTMAKALFIDTLRRYMRALPEAETGWLAAARDPIVGAAIALLHESPARAWSLADLATEVGASRSALGERFARFLGEPPLAYLARWRLHLAARILRTSKKSVLEVAMDVGYQSESAFNRAFRREHGLPPGQYRKASS
jgi:AraC-like DNA-binding protein